MFGLGTAMGLLVMALVGLVVGALAKLLVPGRDPGGVGTTLGIGIAGSLLGGAIGRELGMAAGFLLSVGGAVLLLLAYRFLRRVDRPRG